MIDSIAVDPGIHFGKPCIAGTRITVQSVLELLDEGLSFTEITQNHYPIFRWKTFARAFNTPSPSWPPKTFT